MSTVAVDIKPSAPTSLQVTSNSTASVDVGPAIVQSVAIEDINGQYAVELAMVSLGPQGPEGKPGRVIDILGTFGITRSPSDLPTDGFIPANWDSPGKPAKSIQFTVGDALTYMPTDIAQPAYGHNFAFTGGAYADAWLDCGVIKGDKGDTGSVGPVGAKGDTGSVGPANNLAIGNVVTGASASASITGLAPNQTLNLVLPKGDTGADGHSPAVNMNGDQITVDGVIVGPHLTGPQGPQGEVGKSLTILGYYATEALLRAAHPTGALGDCYLVGDGYLYVWGTSGWDNVGQLQGPKGDTGPTGSAGPANTLSIGAVTSGATPSVTIRGASPNQILDFVLQKGDTGAAGAKGDTGATGPANTLTIGSVTSSDTASATITGASPNQTLNLVLPKGDKGDPGSAGSVGPKGDTGATGSAGPANTLTIGTVSSGGTAAANITGAAPNQTLNLVLPKGDTGAQGPAGSDATVTKTNVVNALGYTPPQPTGTGASGSWPISITGSAASASTATTATNATQLGGVAASSYAQLNSPTFTTMLTVPKVNLSGCNISGGSTFYITVSGANVCSFTSNAQYMATGNAFKPGGGAWLDSSDRRLKRNITKLDCCLDKINALNPVRYDWHEGYRDGTHNVGFIADEVEKVIPTAVTEHTPVLDYDEDGNPKHSDDHEDIVDIIGEGKPVKALGFGNDFFAYLVGAIKELTREINELRAEVDDLKEKVNK